MMSRLSASALSCSGACVQEVLQHADMSAYTHHSGHKLLSSVMTAAA